MDDVYWKALRTDARWMLEQHKTYDTELGSFCNSMSCIEKEAQPLAYRKTNFELAAVETTTCFLWWVKS